MQHASDETLDSRLGAIPINGNRDSAHHAPENAMYLKNALGPTSTAKITGRLTIPAAFLKRHVGPGFNRCCAIGRGPRPFFER
jgi:hypothetical protein